MPYIPRTLVLSRGNDDERIIVEDDVASISAPIVILGDPGLGKTELTKELERRFGFTRITGGAFYRTQNLSRLTTSAESKLIIDGLDEITSSSDASAIDEVLRKLSQIGNPNFILSCRSADWQGFTDRYKIAEDYGVEPVTLHLEPFTYEDARAFLNTYSSAIVADQVLDRLDVQDLSEFYINPLTLMLLAELVSAGQELPNGRADLFERASQLLTSERNPIHQRSRAAQTSLTFLLDSAGAIFAHLLLSGSIGVTDRAWTEVPDGYVHLGELQKIAEAPAITESLKTRLLQSQDENLYAPFHRVIAEFLAARWLSKRLANGLSERRLFQTLSFDGGVPTSFRGVHAWLAHFSPNHAATCIEKDPYGVLRYGDPDQMPVDQARRLLRSLASLAKEDPYFRSEDWGRRAICGLARPELKDEIIAILTEERRHIHLSTLVLESLQRSSLTKTIVNELRAIVENCSAEYAERSRAAEALVVSGAEIKWSDVVDAIEANRSKDGERLTLEIIAKIGGAGFSGQRIAEAILQYEKSHDDESEEEVDHPYVSGVTFGITRAISPQLSGEVLDEMIRTLRCKNEADGWRPGYELASALNQLIERALQDERPPSADRIWSWLTVTESETGYSSQEMPIDRWLVQHPTVRREIQKIAINAATGPNQPWLTIAHDLPSSNRGLALTSSDVADMLTEVGAKNDLTERDVMLWADLVRSQLHSDGTSEEIRRAAALGKERHKQLEERWQEITTSPKRDWKREEEERKKLRDDERSTRFAEVREIYLPLLEGIASGREFGPLVQIAKAYLGQFAELNLVPSPQERIRFWLGSELTEAALEGFVAALDRPDIPSVDQIAETHAENKYKYMELLLLCGTSALVMAGRSLSNLSESTAAAALAAWWEWPSSDSKGISDETRNKLEECVLSSDAATEEFLTSIVAPGLRAGHPHVPGLHRISREARFRSVIGRLSIGWLTDYPLANSQVQLTLVCIAIEHATRDDLRRIIRERLSDFDKLGTDIARIWISAAFIADFEESKEQCTELFGADKNYIWTVAELLEGLREEDDENIRANAIEVEQREFLVRIFGGAWPTAGRPNSSMGRTNPWNAADIIQANIRAIGAEPTERASASLERLSSLTTIPTYDDQIKHTRVQQLRLRRDAEFRVPSFGQIKEILAGKLPANIDDLKAMFLDRLEAIQDYIKNGDTNAWETFWIGDSPKDENTCRDRLLDYLRPKIPAQVNFLPEITMPDVTRADIVAIYRELGLPIEIKGQWHRNVWNAASVQLIEKYARDWRADDRGIYLVVWFGDLPGKNLPRHPEGLSLPRTSSELRKMLESRLPSTERYRIDIFILDVSKPGA